MSNPTRSSWAKAKKLARYLVGRRRVVWEFAWQEFLYFGAAGLQPSAGGGVSVDGPLCGWFSECWVHQFARTRSQSDNNSHGKIDTDLV